MNAITVKIQKWVEGLSNEQLVAHLDKYATAQKQLEMVRNLQKACIDWTGVASHMPTLGDTIAIEQFRKIERFGDKTFKLSDKQLAVIAREAKQAMSMAALEESC